MQYPYSLHPASPAPVSAGISPARSGSRVAAHIACEAASDPRKPRALANVPNKGRATSPEPRASSRPGTLPSSSHVASQWMGLYPTRFDPRSARFDTPTRCHNQTNIRFLPWSSSSTWRSVLSQSPLPWKQLRPTIICVPRATTPLAGVQKYRCERTAAEDSPHSSYHRQCRRSLRRTTGGAHISSAATSSRTVSSLEFIQTASRRRNVVSTQMRSSLRRHSRDSSLTVPSVLPPPPRYPIGGPYHASSITGMVPMIETNNTITNPSGPEWQFLVGEGKLRTTQVQNAAARG